MSRKEKNTNIKEVTRQSTWWGIIAIIYLSLLLGILYWGVKGLLSVDDKNGPQFIYETMIESGFDGLVIGFIVFAITNAFIRLSENTKKIENLKKK